MANRFARITEEVFLRHKELAEKVDANGKPKLDANGKPLPAKGALQTLYLYQVILLHSWATGVLDKDFDELCRIYGLDLDNSYRRLKILRTKGWIADSTKYIRPLLTHRAGESKTVKNTVQPTNGTVKITVENDPQAVKITADDCKNYSQTGEQAVIFTVENGESPNPISNYGDSKTLLDLKTDLDSTTSSSSKKNLSKFSEPECLRYVEIRIERGEKLETPHKFAKWLHQTGEMDVFIEATLYPPELSVTTSPPVEYADDEFFDELPPAEPLTDDERESSLSLLRSMLRETAFENLESFSANFTREDWAWLKGELQNAG